MFAKLMGLKTITPADLHQLLDERRPVTVMDVNSPQHWDSAHIPGARNLDALRFTEADLPADRDALLVFYCSGFLCRKAPNAARRAKHMGFRNACVMSAGISGWLSASLPVEAGI